MSRAPKTLHSTQAAPSQADMLPSPHNDSPTVDRVDTSFLETLMGYNARRAALSIIGLFLERMAVYNMRPVDFSVMSVVRHNPGVTSRQLCATLGLLPPNLVLMINQLEKRQLLERRPHPHDGRAMGLHLTPQGTEMMEQAETTAYNLELEATSRMTSAQRATMIRLLKMVYLPEPKAQNANRPSATTHRNRRAPRTD